MPYARVIVASLSRSSSPACPPCTRRVDTCDASPALEITAHSAPMLIVQGTNDQLIEEAQSRELQRLLQVAGVPVRYISFDGGHMFSGLSQGQQSGIMLQETAYVMQHEQP